MSIQQNEKIIERLIIITKYAEGAIFEQPLEDGMLTWVAVIIGPQNTPFENRTFPLLLSFDESYPNHPPEVTFNSKMFHPNIYPN